MTKEIGVGQRNSLFAQKGTELFCTLLFSFGRSSIGKRGKELLEFATCQLVVDPGRPLFLKRFHKHPSINSAAFCGHRRAATSRSRWNSRVPPQSRDIACLPFPSSKSQPDVPAKVARSPRRSAIGLRAVPFADVAALQPGAPFSKPDRSRAIAHCHRIRCRPLSPVFCEANQWSHSSRFDTARCKTTISRESEPSISTLSRNCLERGPRRPARYGPCCRSFQKLGFGSVPPAHQKPRCFRSGTVLPGPVPRHRAELQALPFAYLDGGGGI